MDIPIYLLHGFVLKVLWGWFVVPIFHLPELGIAQAIGLAIIVGFLTIQSIPQPEEEESERRMARVMSHNILTAIFALFSGWVVHLFL